MINLSGQPIICKFSPWFSSLLFFKNVHTIPRISNFTDDLTPRAWLNLQVWFQNSWGLPPWHEVEYLNSISYRFSIKLSVAACENYLTNYLEHATFSANSRHFRHVLGSRSFRLLGSAMCLLIFTKSQRFICALASLLHWRCPHKDGSCSDEYSGENWPKLSRILMNQRGLQAREGGKLKYYSTH